MKFLIDSQLPPALARWIVTQGHHATHGVDLGLEAADDANIWEHARQEQAVIISKDEDFADRWLLRSEGVALVWIRKGNCSNRALIAWIDLLWPAAMKRLEQGESFIELRG